MKKLILAAFFCLLPHALHAQAAAGGGTTPAAVPLQEKSTPSPQSPELQEAENLSASVKQLYAAGKYREALPQAQRVLALLEKARGEEDPLVGSALNNVATLHIALNEFGKAEPILERILARREKSKAATSPATLNLLVNYACMSSANLVGDKRGKRDKLFKLIDRVNAILFQDAVLAAGLPLPANLTELSGGLVIKKPQPRYPREALNTRLQGTVLMSVEGDEEGKVLGVAPVPCWDGQKLLADAAAEAMRGGRLKPVVINGRPVKLKVLTTYGFVIEF